MHVAVVSIKTERKKKANYFLYSVVVYLYPPPTAKRKN